jgi:LuxR family maltose regulon positive regulatory protein
VEHARQLLDAIADEDHVARGTATALLSLAQWSAGELDDAYATFIDALSHMRKAGNSLDAIRGEFVPADIRVAQGRLHEAEAIYESGLQLAKDSLHSAAAETDELYLGLSELHREWGDFERATSLLQTLTESAGRAEHAGNRRRWCESMARVAESRGDLPSALRLLDEAERVDVRSPLPRLRPIAAMRARIWITQGKLREAAGWAKEQRLSVDDDLSYAREFEHITLARLLIARYRSQHDESTIRDALMLLERLLIEASRGGRKPGVIEVLVLEALAHDAMSNNRAALDPLERALLLGESEGYLRIFVDEGNVMRDLLRHATQRGIGGDYTRSVLRAFDEPTSRRPEQREGPAPLRGAAFTLRPVGVAGGPIQSLTARELEILRLIAVGLRNQQIADQLSISTPTVKRHVANAYAKLGVSHRTEALVRAHALNIL